MASKVCSEYKLDKRAWHSTQVIGDSLYLWSGDQPNFPKVHNNNEKKRLTSQVQVFNIISGKWDTKPTRGNPPLGVSGYSCATLNNKIYYFGGFCRHDICYHNSLNVLDTSSLTWTQISPTDDRRPVMKRGFGGMMLTEYEGVHRLVVIGGSGSPPSTQLPQTQYIQLPSGRIRTNEQNIYNMSTNKWIVLYISGQCMPPNSGFVMEMIHNTRGIIFGGRVEDGTTSNTVYIVDIINNTLHWQTITKPDPVIQWPEKRWGHAASVITVSISPVLMVIGGMDINEKTIKDCWILDVNEISWTKINLSHSVTEKYGHSLSIYMMGLQCLWLVIAGGVVNVDGVPVTDPNITMLIELHGSPHDGQWSVGFVLDSNELSSSNNYQQRILKQLTEVRRQWIEQRIKSSQDQDDLSNPYEKIQSLQHRIHELESECDRQQQELSSDNEAFKTSQRVSSGEQLDITSLDEVVDILEKNHFRRSDWQRLGLRLGLYHPTLECIDKKYREDPDLCLQECLACWLHGQDKVQKIGGHTWSSLALAVQKIGYHDIANKIKPGLL